MKQLFFKLCMLGGFVVLLSACNGLFEGIYDDPAEKKVNDFGFIEMNESKHSGKVYINATSYTQWIYINFHNHSIDSVVIKNDNQEPTEWDIAVHRYDAKTNGGSAIDTGFTGFEALKASSKIPEGDYVEDIWTDSKIIIDMSGMMEGKIQYTESFYNPELSKWLKVDTSTMPPDYKLSNKVYLVKLKDGTHLALRLSNFMNSSSVKGYMTIEYIYPFEI